MSSHAIALIMKSLLILSLCRIARKIGEKREFCLLSAIYSLQTDADISTFALEFFRNCIPVCS
jgi:hypothetical protein